MAFDDTPFPSPSDWSSWVQLAADHLQAQHPGERLTKATELALAYAVTIEADGTAKVQSGNRFYHIDRDLVHKSSSGT